MNCVRCSKPTTVIDMVNNIDDKETYRLRKCGSCGNEFYTVEFETELTKDLRDKLKKYSPKKRRLAKIRPVKTD